MTRRIKMFTNKSNTSILLLALLVSVTATAPLLSARAAADNAFEQAHAGHQQDAPAKLVELVRDATRQFVDVNATYSTDYKPLFGCVIGPDHDAMGVYYISMPLVGSR